MALTQTLPGWLEEIRYSKGQQAQYLKGYREDLKEFVGTGWRDGFGRNQPENHALEWFSLMRAQCLMGNPRVRYATDVPGKAQLRAQALSYAMSNWTRQTRMRNLNEKLLMDWGFRKAVCLVTSAPAPGYVEHEDSPMWPAGYRIGPERFLSDPGSQTPEQWEWTATLHIHSRKNLLRLAQDPESGWNADALNRLEKWNVKQFRDANTPIPERDEVPVWEIHAASIELDETGGPEKGYHGTTFTVADQQTANVGWIRKPMPYFGPRAGPVVVSGDYVVPDDPNPLSHISATRSQATHLNRVSRATIKGIEAYKQVVFARNGEDLEKKIKAARDLWVYSYDDKDLRSALVQMQIGGATEQHFAAKASAQATLDRVSGVTDEMRGETAPDVKATQAALAAQSASARGGFTTAKFRDFVAEIIRRAGYFASRDHDVRMPFGQEGGLMDPETGEIYDELVGGKAEDEDPDEYDRMGMEILVGSMDRDVAADTAFRTAVMEQTFSEMAMAGPQASLFMDCQAYLDAKAELTGVEELKRLVNVPRMQAVGAMMLLGDGSPQEQTKASSGSQPRLAQAPKPQASQKPGGGLAASQAKKAGSPPSGPSKAPKKPAMAGTK